MEVAAVDPILLNMDDEPGIKAGMMAIIPSRPEDREIPEGTLLCAGQEIDRNSFKKLSSIYTDNGGFYKFQLPDLVGRFIIGVNESGEFMMGDAVIYYEDIPSTDPPSRDILDHA